MSSGYEFISPDDASNYENINVRGVTGVFMNDDGQIAILQHNKFDGMWVLPGGKVDEGESEIDAIIREVWEELGITVLACDLQPVVRIRFEWTLPGGEGFATNQAFIIKTYLGEVFNVERETKHEDLRWVTLDELIDLTRERTTAATKACIQLLQES